VVDISMPGMNGFEAVRRIQAVEGERAAVVYFTSNANHAYVRKAFRTGAAGYVWKGSALEDLPVALRAALRGQTFVSPSIGFGEAP
jgi:DNA-binding NarL/FixJ family response regulator